MRIFAICATLLALTACNRGIENKEAVRQGVLDYLATKPGLNASSMNIDVTDVKFENNQATANVSFAAKDTKSGAGGMSIPYVLEKTGNKWVVKGKAGSAGSGHGAGGAMPGGAMPGGAMPGGAMPGGMMPGMPPASGAPREIPGADLPKSAPAAPKK